MDRDDPVIVATCLAWSIAGAFDPAIALIALAASVLMQVVTNLQNDVGYTERGERRRAAASACRGRRPTAGCPRREVKRAIVAAIVLAQVVALPLMIRGGWPIVLTSVTSTLAAYGYMGGPRPDRLHAVRRAHRVRLLRAGRRVRHVLRAGRHHRPRRVDRRRSRSARTPPPCCSSTTIATVRTTRATGRHTLPVVIGAAASRRLYALLLLLPFALALVLAWSLPGAWFALPLLALPWALRLVARAREHAGRPGAERACSSAP